MEGRWQGSHDIPLDNVGEAQAELLAKRLEKYPIKAVYSSPLQRAAKTAEVAAKKLCLDVAYHDGLREICLGIWEGLSLHEIKMNYPKEMAKWDSDINAQVGMGIESNFDAQARAKDALLEICDAEKRDLLIVSHGGIINRLMCWLLQIPLGNRTGFRIQNTGICILECFLSDERPRFQVVTLNDFSHLFTDKGGVGLAMTTF